MRHCSILSQLFMHNSLIVFVTLIFQDSGLLFWLGQEPKRLISILIMQLIKF